MARIDGTSELAAVGRLCWQVADRGARLYVDCLRQGERVMLSLLKQRMDVLELPPPGRAPRDTQTAPAPNGAAGAMEGLLARSLEQSVATERSELLGRIVRELVPDEARILARLTDDNGAALVHIETLPGRRMLENATLLGRTAALTLPEMTGHYIGKLLQLGLVEVSPACPELKEEYEILLADRPVRAALKQKVGPVPARAIRRSLQLSRIGRELVEPMRATSER